MFSNQKLDVCVTNNIICRFFLKVEAKCMCTCENINDICNQVDPIYMLSNYICTSLTNCMEGQLYAKGT